MKKIKAAILTIGDEILIGQITDTNSVFLAEHLTLSGVSMNDILTVGDCKKKIFSALDYTLTQNDIVIITGGLGPTEDDITKATLADYFNSNMILNQEVAEDVGKIVQSRNLKMNELNKGQALVPDNCKVIRNLNGTAPGMWFEKDNKVVVSLPAVPFEMKAMFLKSVLPLLKAKFELPIIKYRTILTHGVPESHLAEMLNEWETALPKQVKLAYLASPERVRLRLGTECRSGEEADAILNKQVEELHKILGKAIYGEGDYFLEQSIFQMLKKRNKTVSTAESCTGGYLASRITSVAGSSAVFKGGIVAYSNEIKEKLLDIPAELIRKHGAVSKEVARAMAEGTLRSFNTDYAMAVTGIAGPGGGTVQKPVGTVWIAVADKQQIVAAKYNFGQRRDINIRRSSAKAMDMLRKLMLDF